MLGFQLQTTGVSRDVEASAVFNNADRSIEESAVNIMVAAVMLIKDVSGAFSRLVQPHRLVCIALFEGSILYCCSSSIE